MSNDFQPTPTLSNTNKWSTRQLVIMALMCALSILLSFIEFPLIPGAAWLKYDASAMPAMVSGFAFGPVPGVVVGIVSAIVHGVLLGNPWGAVMNIVVICGMVIPAGLLYKKNRTWKGAIIGLVISIVITTILAILANLVVDPLYLGLPFDAVLVFVPVIALFNPIKGIINSALTLLIYKSISNLITPKKKQVRGR